MLLLLLAVLELHGAQFQATQANMLISCSTSRKYPHDAVKRMCIALGELQRLLPHVRGPKAQTTNSVRTSLDTGLVQA
jgi:hypothetical protein